MARARRLLPVLLLALAPMTGLAQDSMRCPGGLVSVGDSKLDLLGKCGKPALVEERLQEGTTLADRERGAAWKVRITASLETWTYDFGPSRFVQYVTLDTGRIVALEHGSYGYAAAAESSAWSIPRARCEPRFHEGDSTFDVLARCGPPATRDARLEERAISSADGGQQVTLSRTYAVEIWSYDFGPRSFVRHLTFADGKLVKIETGSSGYAP